MSVRGFAAILLVLSASASLAQAQVISGTNRLVTEPRPVISGNRSVTNGTDLDVRVPLNPSWGGSDGEILRGEWQTAGAPIPPYEPPYQFEYLCQAELSDGTSRQDPQNPGSSAQLFAVTRFKLNNEQGYIGDFLKLPWTWVLRTDNGDRIVSRPTDAFSLRGHSVYLAIRESEPRKPHVVSLGLDVALDAGGYQFSNRESVSSDRWAESFSGAAWVEASRVSQNRNSASNNSTRNAPERVSRKLFVECVKKR